MVALYANVAFTGIANKLISWTKIGTCFSVLLKGPRWPTSLWIVTIDVWFSVALNPPFIVGILQKFKGPSNSLSIWNIRIVYCPSISTVSNWQTVDMKLFNDVKNTNNEEKSCKKRLKIIYNIPRACLRNRSPVPAMDLKSNRWGLWRHLLETCRRLRRLCRKLSHNVARHDKTPVKSTLLSRDKNILSRDMISMSRRSDSMLWLLDI